jgi:hypothetical protein
MIQINKKSLENSGLLLIAVFFIFDGLQKLIDNYTETDKF